MNKFNFRVWNKENKKFSLNKTFDEVAGLQMCSNKTDKKGKDIYAGDIVKIHNKSEYTKKEYWFPIYEVTWDGFEFGLKYLGGGKRGNSTMFTFCHYPKDLEVIGNIFESTIIIPK